MTPREFRERLKKRGRRAGLAVGAELGEGLWLYFELLSTWNRKINLTSLTDPDEAIDRLLIEPIAAARFVPSPGAKVIDIGSGGGSPALPMKLAVPAMRMWLVEAKTRKAAFLREAVRHLALSDICVETNRYEELLTRPDLHESMDLATLRAIKVDPRVLVGIQAFVAPGGRLFLFRGGSSPAEPFMIPPLVHEVTHKLVDSLGSHLVVLRKTER